MTPHDVPPDAVDAPSRRLRARQLAPFIAGAAVVAVVSGIAVAVQFGNTSAAPPLLHLSSAAKSGIDSAAPQAALNGVPYGYVLRGTLPTDGPTSGRVHPLGSGQVDASVVQALGKALRIGAAPVHKTGGWVVADGSQQLIVSDHAGQSWTYTARGCPDVTIEPDSGVACAVATGAGTATPKRVTSGPKSPPSPATDTSSGGGSAPSSGSGSGSSTGSPGTAVPPPAPSGTPPSAEPVPSPRPPVPEASAASVASPILSAVGLAISDATSVAAGEMRVVSVSPVVAGLPVSGFDTSVWIGPDGVVDSASGWLGSASDGPSYPLISAAEALAALQSMPRELGMMAPDICQVGPDGKGCISPAPHVITGAVPGLLLQGQTDGGSLLVPAWLFTIEGSSTPLAAIAVEPKYLGEGETPGPSTTDRPTAVPPAPGSEPGCATGACPGTGGSAEPAPPPACPDSVSCTSGTPVPGRASFSWSSAVRVDDTHLAIHYYDNGCTREHVTAAAKESNDAVYVLLESDAQPADQVCTQQAIDRHVTVTLQAPLGNRAVYDAMTNERHAVG